jgi:hypothetical protein
MDALMCNNCGQALGGDDAFCGFCGTPSSPAVPAQNGTPHEQPNAGRSSAGAGVPFFGHASPRPPGPLSNTTRYLCAAAYLDDSFANQVLRHLIATRRAVAPSVNLDIGPIIWHCRRARRNLLIRNIVLVIIVLVGLILSPQAAFSFLFYTVSLGWLLPKVKWGRRGFVTKILIVLIAVGLPIFFSAIVFGLSSLVNSANTTYGQNGPFDSTGQGTGISESRIEGTFLLLLVLTWAVEFAYIFVTYRTLIEELRLGAGPPLSRAPSGGTSRSTPPRTRSSAPDSTSPIACGPSRSGSIPPLTWPTRC